MTSSNIYVDELPKKCVDCPFSYKGYAYDFDEVRFCKLQETHMNWISLYVDKYSKCPLNKLSDRLTEERKKVVMEIKFQARLRGVFGQKCKDMTYYEFNEILDQIEGANDV